MIAHTREVMAAAHMPTAAIDALLADLEEKRAGKPSIRQRSIEAEMTGG